MTVQTFATLVALESSACGRVSLDALSDAAADIGSATTTCDAAAPFTSIRMLPDLSSTLGDGGLRLSGDELTAYFHSERPAGLAYGLFTATRPTLADSFGTPVAMNLDFFFPAVTSDDRTLAYDDGSEIYVTTRTDTSTPFTAASGPYAGVSTPLGEQHPYFAPDGSALYFTRESTGVPDLYFSVLPNGPGQPLTTISTGAVEGHPVISADGLTLYYGSRVSIAVPWDIWRATRASTADSFAPGALVAELDDPDNDAPTSISADNCRLYFESARTAGGGMYDLYIAERAP